MENKGVLEMLFDLSFSEFVTTRVIKLLFIIGVGIAAIGTLVVIVNAFSSGFGRGFLTLLISPLLFLLYTLFARIWCEMIIVVFRIAENTSRMVRGDSAATTNSAPPNG
jgi:hypothetical protein